MHFLELTSEFEIQINKDVQFELLELNYLPYAFGSGTKAYRMKGKNIKIHFDGKENVIEVFVWIGWYGIGTMH
jgi:hypothetical protein